MWWYRGFERQSSELDRLEASLSKAPPTPITLVVTVVCPAQFYQRDSNVIPLRRTTTIYYTDVQQCNPIEHFEITDPTTAMSVIRKQSQTMFFNSWDCQFGWLADSLCEALILWFYILYGVMDRLCSKLFFVSFVIGASLGEREDASCNGAFDIYFVLDR